MALKTFIDPETGIVYAGPLADGDYAMVNPLGVAANYIRTGDVPDRLVPLREIKAAGRVQRYDDSSVFGRSGYYSNGMFFRDSLSDAEIEAIANDHIGDAGAALAVIAERKATGLPRQTNAERRAEQVAKLEEQAGTFSAEIQEAAERGWLAVKADKPSFDGYSSFADLPVAKRLEYLRFAKAAEVEVIDSAAKIIDLGLTAFTDAEGDKCFLKDDEWYWANDREIAEREIAKGFGFSITRDDADAVAFPVTAIHEEVEDEVVEEVGTARTFGYGDVLPDDVTAFTTSYVRPKSLIAYRLEGDLFSFGFDRAGADEAKDTAWDLSMLGVEYFPLVEVQEERVPRVFQYGDHVPADVQMLRDDEYTFTRRENGRFAIEDTVGWFDPNTAARYEFPLTEVIEEPKRPRVFHEFDTVPADVKQFRDRFDIYTRRDNGLFSVNLPEGYLDPNVEQWQGSLAFPITEIV